MIFGGLVSVTFRQLAVEEIILLVVKAGLNGIEWGGDIHVPHGDTKKAARVNQMMADAGLSTVEYGSYYRAGHPEDLDFGCVLDTALALGSPAVRVWAGKMPSVQADEAYRCRVMEDACRIHWMAKKHGIGIHFEYHAGTLTDTLESALQLLNSIPLPNVNTLWQPPAGSRLQDNIKAIQMLSSRLSHMHVFSWELPPTGGIQRLPFGAHRDQWTMYLSALQALPGDHFALLEFVANDDPEQFMQDAAALQGVINGLSFNS